MAITSGSYTIKSAGGDYSTWTAFWNDIGNLTGNLTCTVDASAFATEATIPAQVTETLGGYTLKVTAATFPSATNGSDGPRFTFNNAGQVTDLAMVGPGTVIIEGLVFNSITTNPNSYLRTTGSGTSFIMIIRRMTCKNYALYPFQKVGANLTDYRVYNNIVYDCGFGTYVDTAFATGFISNNTFVDQGAWGVQCGNIAGVYENNISFSNATDYFNPGNATGNNNADSDDTGEDADWSSGSNNVNSISDPFNNWAGDDFTITAAGVVGAAGKDLSGSFTGDFFGTTRVNWSIGACEYVPPEVAPKMDYYRRRRA